MMSRYLSDGRLGGFATGAENRFVVILIHIVTDRLSWLAQREGKQRALVEAALQAYFTHGRDIGSPDVLAEIAGGVGFALAFALSIFGALFIR